jgi:replicative DNA helicase
MLERDRANLTKASPRIHEAPIFVNDASSLTIMDLKAQARRLKRDHDIQLIVVDYLQIMKSGVYKDNREQEIAYISMNLKAMAKDLKIPVLVAAQLSRPMKGTEGKPPTLSDLRESGSLEQDADVVIFIHKWKTKDDGWKHQLMLSKQRSGPTDDEIPITFSDFSTTFSDVDKGV